MPCQKNTIIIYKKNNLIPMHTCGIEIDCKKKLTERLMGLDLQGKKPKK